MSSFEKKLLDRLGEYQDAGIFDAAARGRFESYLTNRLGDSRQSTGSVMRYILCSLASLVIAMGIILFIAHNWDALSKGPRLALGFAPLLASGALACWYFLTRENRSAFWREVVPALNLVGIVTSIGVVCQVYQIQSDTGGFIRAVILLSIALPFLFNSGLAAGVILWLPLCFFADSFRILPINFIIGIATFCAMGGFLLYSHARGARNVLKSLAMGMLCAAFPIFFMVCAGGYSGIPDNLIIFVLASFFGALIACFARWGGAPNAAYAAPARIVATSCAFILLLVLSYSGVFGDWGGYFPVQWFSSPTIAISLALALVLTVIQLSGCVSALRSKEADKTGAAISLMMLVGLLNLLGHVGFLPQTLFPLMQPLANVLCAAIALTYLVQGLRQSSLAQLNIGSFLLALYVLVKFLSAYGTLLTWSLSFIGLGLLLLAINFIFISLRKKGTR